MLHLKWWQLRNPLAAHSWVPADARGTSWDCGFGSHARPALPCSSGRAFQSLGSIHNCKTLNISEVNVGKCKALLQVLIALSCVCPFFPPPNASVLEFLVAFWSWMSFCPWGFFRFFLCVKVQLLKFKFGKQMRRALSSIFSILFFPRSQTVPEDWYFEREVGILLRTW